MQRLQGRRDAESVHCPPCTPARNGPALRQCIALLSVSFALSTACSAGTAPIDAPVILPSAGPLTSSQLSGVPEQWHAYLQAAHEADRIVDPMARCLAFPDLPGTHWPREQTVAHCRAHHAPHLAPAEVLGLIEEGKVDSLEQQVLAYEKAHQDPRDHDETIHVFYSALAGSAEGDRATARWLRSAPHSPRALTARAAYLVAEAQKARGQDYIADTSPEALQRMATLLAEAKPLYEEASRTAPSGLHVRLLAHRAAMLSGQRKRMDAAFEEARAIDAGCEFLASERMTSLRPRWGGAYPEMQAYADSLGEQVASRPRIAQQLVEPMVDRAEVLLCDRPQCAAARSEAESLLRDALDKTSDESTMRDLQWSLEKASLSGQERYEAYILALQRSRFVPHDLEYDSLAIRLPRDPAWRLQYADRAFHADPNDANARARTGDLYFQFGRPDIAEERLRGCVDDARFGGQCLQSLAWGWLSTTSLPPAERSAHARPWLDIAQSRQPEAPLLWLYRAVATAYAGDTAGEQRAFEHYDALPEAGQRENVNRRAAFVRIIDQTLGRTAPEPRPSR